MMEALNTFSQHSPQLGAVAEIYSTAATWEDVNDMVSLRCGENLVCWAVETLGRQWLENTEQQMALWNYDISNINDTDDGNGNSMGSLQDMRANTGKEKGTCLARSPWRGQYYQCPQVVAHELSNSIGEGSCKSSIRDPANVMKLTIQETTHHTLPTMKVTSSRLGVLRPSANVTAQWDEARGHAEDWFQALECQKVWRTKQNPLGSADFWTVTDKVVFGLAICAGVYGQWKHAAKRRSGEDLDGRCGEDAVWWAPMHIMEGSAKKSHRNGKRTNDTPWPTPKKPTTSEPPGQPGPSGQPEPSTPDSSISTPMVETTPSGWSMSRGRSHFWSRSDSPGRFDSLSLPSPHWKSSGSPSTCSPSSCPPSSYSPSPGAPSSSGSHPGWIVSWRAAVFERSQPTGRMGSTKFANLAPLHNISCQLC